jgi:asparagine synthase (glutamine-hydrolysing)
LHTKIPRALRFNDRISMRSSTELREPFLDHRLFELAFRQPRRRKINADQGKWFLRRIVARSLPTRVAAAAKRPLQTPQREWLRGPLHDWSTMLIDSALAEYGGTWFDMQACRRHWNEYCAGRWDNSFFVWQWISLGLMKASEPATIHG